MPRYPQRLTEEFRKDSGTFPRLLSPAAGKSKQKNGSM
jgi:hypothetical protein